MVAVGIARMKASSSVVQSTIYMVVAESSNLFLDIVGGLKERTSKFLCERGFREDDEEVRNLLETFEQCESHISNLEILISRINILSILVSSLGP